jgi:hypothetical protein
MTNSEAREALRVALGDRAAAEAALAHAREVSDRAREILEGVTRDGEKLDADLRRAAEAVEDQLRGAVLTGAAPSAPASDRDAAKTAAARAAIAVRQQAAERVVSDFAAAERDAAEAFQDAQASVASAVKNVIRSEAARLASRWAVVDEEARALRTRLGAPYGVLTNVGALDDTVLRGITANADDRTDLLVNSAVEASWSSLAAELQSNFEARIDFGPVDQARESARADRERVRVSTSDIIAQLRAPRAPEPTDDPCWLDYMNVNDEAIA